jgi:hypothetical protein
MYVELDQIIGAVETDTARGEGINLRNLSPYGIILRALFTHQRQKVNRFLRDHRDRRKYLTLFLTEEMELGQLPSDAHPNRYYYFGARAEVGENVVAQEIVMRAEPEPDERPQFEPE